MTLNKRGLVFFSVFLVVFVFYCLLQIGNIRGIYELMWLGLRIGISFFLLHQLFLKNKYSYSLRNITYIFFITFFLLAPIGQYFSGIVFWSADVQNHSILRYILADLYLIIFLAIFHVTYNLQYKIFSKIKVTRKSIPRPIPFFTALTFLHLLVFLFFLQKIGFPQMLFRLTNEIEGASSTMGLITGNYIKAFSIVIMIYFIKAKEDNTATKKVLLAINLLIFLLIYFPISDSRFQIIAAYLGLFLIFTHRFKSKSLITILFLAGLFIIFPMLEVFRNLSSFNDLEISSIKESITSAFNEAHYDSFQMLVNCINYVSDNTITWGRQLLGVFLFFVPRTIWPDKPIGSGAYLSEEMNFNFDNISMPIMGEAYINFGFMGIILFAILFGFICRGLDQIYWVRIKHKDNGLLTHFYPVLIGYFFFMNRGDLMSSFAFIVGMYFAFFTIHRIRQVFARNSITEVTYEKY